MPQPIYKEPISPRPQQVSISIYLPDRILLPIMSIVFTHEGNSHPVVWICWWWNCSHRYIPELLFLEQRGHNCTCKNSQVLWTIPKLAVKKDKNETVLIPFWRKISLRSFDFSCNNWARTAHKVVEIRTFVLRASFWSSVHKFEPEFDNKFESFGCNWTGADVLTNYFYAALCATKEREVQLYRMIFHKYSLPLSFQLLVDYAAFVWICAQA